MDLQEPIGTIFGLLLGGGMYFAARVARRWLREVAAIAGWLGYVFSAYSGLRAVIDSFVIKKGPLITLVLFLTAGLFGIAGTIGFWHRKRLGIPWLVATGLLLGGVLGISGLASVLTNRLTWQTVHFLADQKFLPQPHCHAYDTPFFQEVVFPDAISSGILLYILLESLTPFGRGFSESGRRA